MDEDDDTGSAPPLRVGIAAFGMAARTFHVPLVRATPGLSLRAVASSRPDAVREALPQVRVHADAMSLCRDPDLDLVVIPTPNDTHAALAETALDAGRHVVVDKPFALDAAEAERLLGLARDRGLVLTVFQNRRWDGDFLTLARILRSGRIGRPVALHSHFDRFRPAVPVRWRDRPGPGSGLWYDLGPHLVDQALQLFGPPRDVFADLACLRDGAVTDDHFHAVLRYERLEVVLHATTLAAAGGPRFALHGTEGSFVVAGLDPQEAQLKDGAAPGDPGFGLGAPDGRLVTAEGEERVARVPGDYRAFYEGVRDAVRHGGAAPVTPEEALAVMRVLDAGRESGRSGRAVEAARTGSPPHPPD